MLFVSSSEKKEFHKFLKVESGIIKQNSLHSAEDKISWAFLGSVVATPYAYQ